MAGFDRPEWPPRSSRPGDPGDAGEGTYDVDYEPVDDGYAAPPPRHEVPPPVREPRPISADKPRPISGDRHSPGRGTKAGKKHSKGNLLWRWRRGFFVLALVGMVGVAAGVSAIAQTELPPLERMKASSFICAGDVPEGECGAGNSLVKISEDEDRVFVHLADIPQVMRDAVVAAEDRGFYDHKGIDPMGIGRALFRDLKGGGFSQGGSTITQQLVKNAFLLEGSQTSQSADRTVTRKLKEAVLAMKIEKQMSKDEILERYLNEIYFGRNAYGIQAASWAYFGKRIQDVGLHEATYLASLIRSPNAADPVEHAEEALRRRGTVLDAMLEEGYITKDEYDAVDAMDLSYVGGATKYKLEKYTWPDPGGAGGLGIEYVTDFVQTEMVKKVMEVLDLDQAEAEKEVAQGGLRVYTTLDTTMQQQAYDAVWGVLDNPAEDPAAGLVAVDNQGFIRAMVGGRDYNAPTPSATVNLAVGNKWGRQVGSTFKPIALAEALNMGFSLERSRIDAPGQTEEISWDADGDGEADDCDARKFSNYSTEGADVGTLNLVDATRVSSNTAFVNLMVELGVSPVTAMAKRLGMTSERRGANQRELLNCPTTVLGSEESDPLEMAEVFSTFANRGVHKDPTIIRRIERIGEDGDPDVLWNWTPHDEPVLTPTNADLVTHALRQVVEGGTGTAAGEGLDTAVAGKTGTTSSNVDAWFVGYVPKLTAAVWMGYPDLVPAVDGDGQPILKEDGQPKMILPTMNSDPDTGKPVRDRTKGVTGGSFPAEIWNAFMSQAIAGMSPEDLQFVEPTADQLRGGIPIGGEYNDTPDTTLPEEPGDTMPENSTTIVTRPTPSSTPPSSTPGSTSTPPFPPITPPPTTDRPGNGGGGGGGDATG